MNKTKNLILFVEKQPNNFNYLFFTFLRIFKRYRCPTTSNIVFIIKNTYITTVNKLLVSFYINKFVCVMGFFRVICFFIKSQKIIFIIIRNIFVFGANIYPFNIRIFIF